MLGIELSSSACAKHILYHLHPKPCGCKLKFCFCFFILPSYFSFGNRISIVAMYPQILTVGIIDLLLSVAVPETYTMVLYCNMNPLGMLS